MSNKVEETQKQNELLVDHESMPEERAEIISWLEGLKFPRKLIGGVDEVVVWKKITELDALYAKALEAEKIRYNALLERYQSTAIKVIKGIKKEQKTKGSESDG